MPKFSVIIMVYNEEQAIIPLYGSLKSVMDRMGQSYEIIFVNDGSTDSSLDKLKGIDLSPAQLVIVNLKKHSGQATAMQAGFDIIQGELIITMDGDLQNDPEDIPDLLGKMKEGYDVVCGWRYDRKDPWSKVFVSKVAFNLMRLVTNKNIHDFGCTLRIFKRGVLENVYLFRGMHRFFIQIVSKLGYKVGEIKVRHHPRRFGESKYNISNRLGEYLIDCISILFFDIYKVMKRKANPQIREIIRK